MGASKQTPFEKEGCKKENEPKEVIAGAAKKKGIDAPCILGGKPERGNRCSTGHVLCSTGTDEDEKKMTGVFFVGGDMYM